MDYKIKQLSKSEMMSIRSNNLIFKDELLIFVDMNMLSEQRTNDIANIGNLAPGVRNL